MQSAKSPAVSCLASPHGHMYAIRKAICVVREKTRDDCGIERIDAHALAHKYSPPASRGITSHPMARGKGKPGTPCAQKKTGKHSGEAEPAGVAAGRRPRVAGGYAGWPFGKPLPSTLGEPVPVEGLTPQRFWADYVSQRRPVLLAGEPTDASWRRGADGRQQWGDAWLAQHAGDAVRGSQRHVDVTYGQSQGSL